MPIDPDDDISNALNIARQDTGADPIQAKVSGLNQFLTGLDLEANTPQFNTGIGGAGMPSGIRAYHGSPHEFDEFDINKIGTGEGAQAYGHGLYFAEHEPVAKGYRDQLSRPYYETSFGENVEKKYGSDVLDAFHSASGDPKEINNTIDRLRGIVQRNLDEYGVSDLSKLKPQYDGDIASETIKMAKRADNLESLLKSGDVKQVGLGHMYEVNIAAQPEHFLDWDKPLGEQSNHTKQKIKDLMSGDLFNMDFDNATGWQKLPGEKFYEALQERIGSIKSSAADASEALHQHGIRGIRYLDAGSRGENAQPTHNYVVFDPKDIEIMRRYARGGDVRARHASGTVEDHALNLVRRHLDHEDYHAA